MEGDKLLQRYPSPDGRRWVELRQRPDGKFYFQEFSEATDNPAFTSTSRPRKAICKRWRLGWPEQKIQPETLPSFRRPTARDVCDVPVAISYGPAGRLARDSPSNQG